MRIASMRALGARVTFVFSAAGTRRRVSGMPLLLLSAAVLAGACTGEQSGDRAAAPDRDAVASIHDVLVSRDEVDRRYEALRRSGKLKAPLDPTPIKADLTDDLIDELVLDDEARRRGLPSCEGQPDDRRAKCLRSLALVLADADSIEVTPAQVEEYYASHLRQLSDGACTSGVDGPAGAAVINPHSGVGVVGPSEGTALGATSRERLSDWGEVKLLSRNAPGSSHPARVGTTSEVACRREVFEARIEAAIRERDRTTRVAQLLSALRERANARNLLSERQDAPWQAAPPQHAIRAGASR